MFSIETFLTAVAICVAVLIFTMGGFGGGSIFLAILILSGIPPSQAAIGSLLFNIFSTGTSSTLWRIHLEKKFLLLLLGSVPLAFIGGITSFSISEYMLKLVMGLVIVISGLITLLSRKPLADLEVNFLHIVLIGGFIGFLAGLTGIGGGVYLAPILLLGGISEPKTTAATTTLFIFSNSLSGLLARTPRLMSTLLENQIMIVLVPLVVSISLIGGHIGSRKLSQESVRNIIGVILVSIGTVLIFY
ncbi:MAG: sulfite exporter TauE/SafE family protein [Candidatus Caldarchaeales archaeon]